MTTSSKIRDYRDLLAWQRAMELAVECERIANRLPRSAVHLGGQIRRAALSVSANIAEGNGRFSRHDYLRHLGVANGSLREVESHLHFVQRAYLDSEQVRGALGLCELTSKLLAGLVRALRGEKGKGKGETGN